MSYLRRFIFKDLPIRGTFIVLDDVWQEIRSQKDYPEGVSQVLGELMVANVLMTTQVKLDGKIVVQIQDNPKLDLAVSECSNNFTVRATANFNKALHDDQIDYKSCLSKGRLVVSIDSKTDGRYYQSVITLSGSTLSDSINDYMLRSEQLNTLLILSYTQEKVVGFMLQQLPNLDDNLLDEIKKVFECANTLNRSKLQQVSDIGSTLNHIFLEYDVILFDQESVRFDCNCSKQKVSGMLRSLGEKEVQDIILEEGQIKVTCEFCNKSYVYNHQDANELFKNLVEDANDISKEVH